MAVNSDQKSKQVNKAKTQKPVKSGESFKSLTLCRETGTLPHFLSEGAAVFRSLIESVSHHETSRLLTVPEAERPVSTPPRDSESFWGCVQ